MKKSGTITHKTRLPTLTLRRAIASETKAPKVARNRSEGEFNGNFSVNPTNWDNKWLYKFTATVS